MPFWKKWGLRCDCRVHKDGEVLHSIVCRLADDPDFAYVEEDE